MDKSEWSVWCPLNLMLPVMLENIFEEQVRKDCINKHSLNSITPKYLDM